MAFLQVEHLTKEFAAGSAGFFGGNKLTVKAVGGVSLQIAAG